jgi:5,10-methylene-tetrahydrofolate dehydrogenase/Methenyl tetrahydrofolate cyclohydrolase
MAIIISGRELAKKSREDLKQYVDGLKAKGSRVPCIATILVGNDGGSIYYVKNQNKLCNELGITSKDIFLEETISEKELIQIIEELNENINVDGIMLQVPLPAHIDEKKVTSKISYKKDVDGLTEVNTGRLYKGEKCFIPCTPMSVIELIKSTGIELEGKNAVVVGRSNIVGKPVVQLLLNENCTVTICHSKTKNLKEICKTADILVTAIGRPNFITSEFVQEGAVVIDVGTSSVDGKITGDVNFSEVQEVAGFVTPVPGGVGAMTTTLLLRNTCEAFKANVY